jgi:RimJ/RimL family protein N-acetyltransferase
MSHEIKYCSEDLAGSFHRCLDSVAREKKYLYITEAPSADRVLGFMKRNIEEKVAQYLAVDSNGEVIGWCDIRPVEHPTRSHVGELGMGILNGFRGKGIGTSLVKKCLQHATQAGLEKVELQVYETNIPAIELYSKFGFKIVGTRERYRKVDGRYENCVLMELFL